MKKLHQILMRYSLAVVAVLSLASGTSLAKAEPQDFTPAELDQMLAPIALYPDTILSHVLIAATYPLEIVQADRWVRDNPGLEAEGAVAAADAQDWDPSVKALVAFPQILERMSDDLAWTQKLGDAFLDDEAEVMDAIQRLRNHAYASGNLDRVEHLRVQREKEIIIIEPAQERIVYVPVYDTRVVYGRWWWDDYPPIYWHYPAHYTFVHGFYWGPRIHIGSSFYFSSFHWHRRQVVYVDHHRHHHRPHFHSGRAIVRYEGARHWRHNPVHRRGVAYRNERAQQHFGSNRQDYRSARQERARPIHRRQEHTAGAGPRQRHEAVREQLQDRTSRSHRSGVAPNHQVNPRRSEAARAATADRNNTTRPSRAERADPRQNQPDTDNKAIHPRKQLERNQQSTEQRAPRQKEARERPNRANSETITRGQPSRAEGIQRTSRPSVEHRSIHPNRAHRPNQSNRAHRPERAERTR
jgi:hypothetical protein